MTHPRISLGHLSNEAIKGMRDVLMADSYRLRLAFHAAVRPEYADLVTKQRNAAIDAAEKIQAFLNR